ncbi:MAG TPA: acyl-CoA thioesterase domain-containing protein [Mycobacteriales bacterium]|nr:acyl-CoA thioesterase domain-containing protein [Mycobacteriales bacterium]HVU61170.1 acyl-CoA thioesterase domain-containing protein [Mycobacteriales bacterium]
MTDRRTFLTRAGEAFVPTDSSIGPWGPATVSGLTIAGLVGYGAEQVGGDADFVGTRLTVDMVRMARMGELHVTADVVRDGRRLRMVDVTVSQDGRNVAHGRAIFARRSDAPTGKVWEPVVVMPPPPTPDQTPAFGPKPYFGPDARPARDFEAWRDVTNEKYVWYDCDARLVEDEPMSAFVRAAAIADVANPLTNWGSEGMQFVNSDVTLMLSRLPEGTMLGMAARDRQEAGGVSVGSAVMFDATGPVGLVTVTALASMVEMVPRHGPAATG